jgi:hypothetical protein
MALKLVKANIALELKCFSNDPEDVKERLYEALQILIENDELNYTIDEDEEELGEED